MSKKSTVTIEVDAKDLAILKGLILRRYQDINLRLAHDRDPQRTDGAPSLPEDSRRAMGERMRRLGDMYQQFRKAYESGGIA